MNDKIVLIVEGVTFACSKRQLSKESPYFEAMFGGNFMETSKEQIELRDVKLSGFREILKILRKDVCIGDYFKNRRKLYLLLETASMLQFLTILKQATKVITSFLTPDNALEMWRIAEKFGLNELRIKAQYMALTDFHMIKKPSSIFNLNLSYLCRLLSNRNLLCSCEMDVLWIIILWFRKRGGLSVKEREETMFTLLSCLDFKAVSNFDMFEILDYMKSEQCEILKATISCILSARTQIWKLFTLDTIARASILTNCKSRRPLEYPAFIIKHSNLEENRKFAKKMGINVTGDNNERTLLFYYDGKKFKTICDSNNSFLSKPDGSAVVNYKQFIFTFGGEFSIGRETWMKTHWAYDSIKEKWSERSRMPFARRHFSHVVCGELLYIIGGFGNFRVHECNMFWYDCVKDIWSELICLPRYVYTEMKCCEYRQRLFLLNLNPPSAYRFYHESQVWYIISISTKLNIPTDRTKCVLFSYNGNIFIKGNYLNEYTLESATLTMVKTEALKPLPDDLYVASNVVCEDTLYILYTTGFSEKKILECFSMATLRSVEFELLNPDYLFSFRSISICEKEEFVNSYFLKRKSSVI